MRIVLECGHDGAPQRLKWARYILHINHEFPNYTSGSSSDIKPKGMQGNPVSFYLINCSTRDLPTL